MGGCPHGDTLQVLYARLDPSEVQEVLFQQSETGSLLRQAFPKRTDIASKLGEPMQGVWYNGVYQEGGSQRD